MLSDDAIIMLLQKRDEQALREIRDHYGKQCTALAFRILGSEEDAEECVSDLLLTVWNSIPPQEPRHLPAYLLTITRRSAIDRLKTANRIKRGGQSYALALDELAEILPADDSVESEAEQRELARVLKAFLDTLSPQVRYVFMQRYYLSVPVREIAGQAGMRESAVKMTLLRTRKKLKAYLEKEGLL